jgi:alkanesulfonate monooxygenase SsuD/methylene tetrahydromethanopterin reductase-like flavin-dependent oxidoreductase (luciferase family)
MHPLQMAAQAETLGLDYIGLQDQPHKANSLDTWTLLTAIGVATSRISLFAYLTDLPFRSPSILAKAAASLDLLTNGRVEVGLGMSAFRDQLMIMEGAASRDPEAWAVMEEAIQVMRLMWSGERTIHFEGNFYSLADSEPGPSPLRRIRIGLGATERRALGLIGRLADGWIPEPYPTMQPSDLVRLSKHIDDAVTSAGREPSDIRRIWYITGTIGDEDSKTLFQGSVQQWAEAIAELAVEVGIDTFILMEAENETAETAEAQLTKFALEVMPRARELIALAPGAPTPGLLRAYEGAAASGQTLEEEKTDDVDWVDETSMESFPASDPPASSSFT